MRPKTTDKGNRQQKTENTNPQTKTPKSRGQVRNSNRQCQPVEKGETWGDEFSLCTQYVTITSFGHLVIFSMRRHNQHSCSSLSA